MNFQLGKQERLHKRDEIQALFSEGTNFHEYPFRVIHLSQNQEAIPLKFMVSVPKRLFKRAVDRNLLKRRTREAFRLNRNALKEGLIKQNKHVHVLFIYQHKKALPFMEIEAKIKLILLRLEKQYVQGH